MKRFFKYFMLITLFISLSSCNQKLFLFRYDSDGDVILKLNKKHQTIVKIYLPFIVTIKNKTVTKKYFCDIQYLYTDDNRPNSILLFQNDKKISLNGLKMVSAKSNINYSAYSAHYIDTIQNTQKQLRPYINQMLELDQDTLAIGFVDFEKDHGELLKEITKYDSISIRTLKSDKSWEGERIVIPANW